MPNADQKITTPKNEDFGIKSTSLHPSSHRPSPLCRRRVTKKTSERERERERERRDLSDHEQPNRQDPKSKWREASPPTPPGSATIEQTW